MNYGISYAPAEKLAQHIEDLAKAFGVLTFYREDLPPHIAMAAQVADNVVVQFLSALVGEELAGRRFIMVHRVIDESTYAVALHELGHTIAPLGMLGPKEVEGHEENIKLLQENAAWEWAKHHALYWNDLMEFVYTYGINSYLEKKQRMDVKRALHAKPPSQRLEKPDWRAKVDYKPQRKP